MEIQEIKQRLSMVAVLEHYGIRPNRNKMLCCPFHDDKNPSMQVYPETNTVFCFSGNCSKNGKAMDTIQFMQDKENITKHEAIRKAQNLIGTATQQAAPHFGARMRRRNRAMASCAMLGNPKYFYNIRDLYIYL